MTQLSRFILITAFLAFVPTLAHACRCVAPTPVSAAETYNQTNTVVLAEPVFFSKGWGGAQPLVKLKIHHVYKGSVSEEITAQYNASTAACGLLLEMGKTYILGMADLYSASNAGTRRKGGFRLLPSCQQDNIYSYLMELSPTENNQTNQESQ